MAQSFEWLGICYKEFLTLGHNQDQGAYQTPISIKGPSFQEKKIKL